MIYKPVSEWSWIHKKIHIWCIRHTSQLLPDFIVKLLKNQRIGKISHMIFPVTSWCARCLTSWGLVEHHTTDYEFNGERQGMFPLCEACWSELSIDDRLEYYRALYEYWTSDEDSQEDFVPFSIIEQVVREGK